MYRLAQIALDSLTDNKSSRRQAINKLATALKCSENSVYRHIRENVPNGDLTKIAAIEVIREVSGLSDEEILEVVTEKEFV